MSTLGTDNFNQADANPIGGNWTTLFTCNGLKILSNAVQASVANSDCFSYWNAVIFPADHWSQARISTTSAVNDGGVTVRDASAAKTCYFISNYDNFYLHVYKYVNGAATSLASVTGVYAANDIIYLEIQGSTIVLKVNGTQVLSTSDSSITTGSAGGFCFDGTLVLDDWSGGDFTIDLTNPGTGDSLAPAPLYSGGQQG